MILKPTDSSKSLYLELMKSVLTGSIYEESSWSLVCMDRTDWRSHGTFREKVKNLLKYQLIRYLERRSYSVVKRNPFDQARRATGRDWPQLLGYTMVGHRRLDNLQHCIEEAIKHNVPGDLVETGVWRGGATIFMRAVLKCHNVSDRIVWAADSFQGLPRPLNNDDGNDLSAVVHLKVSLDAVRENFSRFGLLDDQVRFLEGWFSDTLPNADIGSIAVLRLDGDLYSSTMESLQYLFPKVSLGGYVIIDDYYSWESCRSAVHDYFKSEGLRPRLVRIDDDAAYWQRLE